MTKPNLEVLSADFGATGEEPDFLLYVEFVREGWDSAIVSLYRNGDRENCFAEIHIDFSENPWPHLLPFLPMMTGEGIEAFAKRMAVAIPSSVVYNQLPTDKESENGTHEKD